MEVQIPVLLWKVRSSLSLSLLWLDARDIKDMQLIFYEEKNTDGYGVIPSYTCINPNCSRCGPTFETWLLPLIERDYIMIRAHDLDGLDRVSKMSWILWQNACICYTAMLRKGNKRAVFYYIMYQFENKTKPPQKNMYQLIIWLGPLIHVVYSYILSQFVIWWTPLYTSQQPL